MKTYTLTESELQELLRQQREICAKPFVQSIAERIMETPSLPTEEVGIKEDDVSQKFLLHLVDVVWMTAKESEEVPSTIWAKKMIKQAKESYVPSDNNNEGASVASHSCTIKPYLQGTIDWEGMQNALIDDESINLSRSWTPHDDVIKWLKINLPNYIK